MINLILKLPGFILLWLSGRKQITLGERKLLPAFQLICEQNEKLGVQYSEISPQDLRANYITQNSSKIGLKEIISSNHKVPVNGDTIEVREYSSKSINKSGPSLVYFHGGGWVIGDTDTHDNICRYICKKLNMKIFSVNYRLSPEYKFPIPFNDCFDAYEWISNNAVVLEIDSEMISVGGDSAGGNLAASICIQRNKENKTLPNAQLLIYPATDLRLVTNSMTKDCSEGFVLTEELMKWFVDHYLDSAELKNDPRVSPLLAEKFEGLPPALIITAGFDPLRDEGLQYSEKLKQENVTIVYKEYPTYIHGFFNMLQVPGIKKSVDEICEEFEELTN